MAPFVWGGCPCCVFCDSFASPPLSLQLSACLCTCGRGGCRGGERGAKAGKRGRGIDAGTLARPWPRDLGGMDGDKD